jgi:succinate dehydrogenase / fumarate reductase membrane anchor subunit
MTDLRTPMARVKGLGVTHKGAAQWKRQRISAAALIPFGIWFLMEILRHTQADHHTVVSWASQPWIGAALALFVGMVFYHGALGLQVVIEDYVPHPFWQMTLMIKMKLLSLILAVLSWFFIIRIAIMGNG